MINDFQKILDDFTALNPRLDYYGLGFTKGQFRNLTYVMHELCSQGHSGTVSEPVASYCEKYKQRVVGHGIGWKIYRSDNDESNNAAYLKQFGKRRLRETEKSRLVRQILFSEKVSDGE